MFLRKLFFVALFIMGVNSSFAAGAAGRFRRSFNALFVDLGPVPARGVLSLRPPELRRRPSPRTLSTLSSLEGDWNEFSTESNADRLFLPTLRLPLVR